LLVVIQSPFWAAAKKSVAVEDKRCSCALQMISASKRFSVTKREKAARTPGAALVPIDFAGSESAEQLNRTSRNPPQTKLVSRNARNCFIAVMSGSMGLG
jgi:hypothetical protein